MVASFALPISSAAQVADNSSGSKLGKRSGRAANGAPEDPCAPSQAAGMIGAADAIHEAPRPGQGPAVLAASTDTLRAAGPSLAAAAPAKQQQHEQAPQAFSPTEVGALHSAAASHLSSDPATPPGDGASSGRASSSGGREPRAGGGAQPASAPASEPSLSDASAAELQADIAAAAAAAAAAAHDGGSGGGGGLQLPGRRRPPVDVLLVVERLKQRPISGQVAAWGWAQAAAASCVRRALPAQLFSALWPATEACIARMMPQDVLEMLEAWLTLMQQCPRHFRLSKAVLEGLATYALPAAVKRMGERELAQLAGLARDIALHRSDAEMQMVSGPSRGASARDLMQPLFALAAAEAAWRCNNPARYVSPETISALINAAPAWSWRVVRYRDSQALAALKLATAAALGELAAHSPRDLSPSALRKLRLDGGGGGGSAGRAPCSGGTTPRQLAL